MSLEFNPEELNYLIGQANPTDEQTRRYLENFIVSWPEVQVTGKKIGGELWGDSFYDVGSGAFPFSYLYGGLFPTAPVFGFDFNRQLIDNAKRIASQRPNIKYSVLDIEKEELPSYEGGVAIVFTSHVLMHLKDPQAAVKKFLGVLKPGGLYWDRSPLSIKDLMSALNHAGFQEMVERAAKAIPGAGIDIAPSLPAMFRDAGLERVEQSRSEYPVDKVTPEGRFMIQVVMLGLKVVGPFVANKEGIPVEEWDRRRKEVEKEISNTSTADSDLGGRITFVNTYGYKPK